MKPIEQCRGVEEQEIHSMKAHLKNRQGLHDAIMSTSNRISKECFSTSCEMHATERLRLFWEQREALPSTNIVFLHSRWMYIGVWMDVCTQYVKVYRRYFRVYPLLTQAFSCANTTCTIFTEKRCQRNGMLWSCLTWALGHHGAQSQVSATECKSSQCSVQSPQKS